MMRLATVLCAFALVGPALAAPSCSGAALGPVPVSGGVCFSVWAPNAGDATVNPENGASWGATKMANIGGGVWQTLVSGAAPGDAYTYGFNGSSIVRLDPRAQGIGNGTTAWPYSIVHNPDFDWGGTSAVPLTPESTVIYELHIPSFNSPTGNTDGTFATAIEKLPFLKALGVNAIELMPATTFGDQPNGWGYNPCAPYAVQEAYGGYTMLKEFVKAANGLGMGVMMDIVFNHAGPNTVLKAYDGYKGAAGNGIYFFEDGRANSPWGPRYAYDTPEVLDFILDHNALFQNEYHISGFRWDSTVCIRKSDDGNTACWETDINIDSGWTMMQAANNATHAAAPSITVAEDDQGWSGITAPTNDLSTGLPGAPGGAGFDGQWGYADWFYDILAAITTANNGDVNMGQVASLLSGSTEGGRVLFTCNHDQCSSQNKGRVPSIVNPGGNPYKPSYYALKKSMLGVGLNMIAPGIPMLFQGEEFVTYAAFDFPVPPPIDWGLAAANAGIVQEVADMVALRRNLNGTTAGLLGAGAKTLLVVDTATEKLAVIHRFGTDGGDVVAIVNMYQTNLSGYTVPFPLDGTWEVRFNGDDTKYSSQYGGFGVGQGPITVSGGTGQVDIPMESILFLSQ